MKFSTRLDADVPATQLFDQVSDFNRLERTLIKRGASVKRIDPASDPGARMGWDITFDWRGRERKLRLEVQRFDRPELLSLYGYSDSLDMTVVASVIAINHTRSRLTFETDIRPRNMRARLMLQTAKLGKSRLDQGYAKRVRELVGDLNG